MLSEQFKQGDHGYEDGQFEECDYCLEDYECDCEEEEWDEEW